MVERTATGAANENVRPAVVIIISGDGGNGIIRFMPAERFRDECELSLAVIAIKPLPQGMGRLAVAERLGCGKINIEKAVSIGIEQACASRPLFDKISPAAAAVLLPERKAGGFRDVGKARLHLSRRGRREMSFWAASGECGGAAR